MERHPSADRMISWEETTQEPHPVILVIEDHPGTQCLLCEWLHLQGYDPVCARNGEEAWHWLEERLQTPASPQAILLDWWMPVMDGRQFLDTLGASRAASCPPIIVLTAGPCDCTQLACESVLIKPFHLSSLRHCLEQITARSRGMSLDGH